MDKVFAASFRGIVCVLTLAGLAACGFDDQNSTSGSGPVSEQPAQPSTRPGSPVTPPANEQPAEPTDPSDGNAAPQIAGSPAAQVAVGQAFNFKPSATDADGDDLSFSIAGKPSWASFDARSGSLSGTPAAADIGSHEDIRITVSDGEHNVSLEQFAVNVIGQANGTATVSWEPPTQNVDGSALVNLKGYRIHYGTEPGSYDQVVTLNNAGLSSYVIDNLGPGTWYFAITAVSMSGAESQLSGAASKTI
jgi:hypothetical protein